MLIGTDTLRDGTGQTRYVVRDQVHPRYNPRTNDNDFLLLRLNKPVQFNERTKRLRVATRCPEEGMQCSVSGWGTIRSPGGNQSVMEELGGSGEGDWVRERRSHPIQGQDGLLHLGEQG